MMYEGVRGALPSDDAQKAAGENPPFQIRETSDWQAHAADLEKPKCFGAICVFES
ncbi:hypothetical protein [Bradyrhizobium canariense]|uniref:hypothetical protein n=1 Tax=Bradyrhizobium canariense TaxID=255045 RepID=UPI001FD9D893|nr:hypothetical protein [Bradyrhizobium canariense]